MSGRISSLKNKIAALRATVASLQMTPDNKYLETLRNEILALKQEGQCKQVTIDSLADKLCKANMEIEHRFSIGYVHTLDQRIDALKQELKSKQITIDSLEFDVDKTEKRVKEENEITIKLSKEIQLLKIREQCSKDDIANLVENICVANKNLSDALETIDKLYTHIKSLDDKKIKNKIKKLFAS